MFKLIEDFPKYEINSEGVVRNVSTGYVLSTFKNVDGYPVVYLRDEDGKNHCKRLHRLLAISFIPNPNNHPVVNHIDSDRENFSLDNLEWTTVKGNVQHAIQSGVEFKYNSKITEEDAERICSLLSEGKSIKKVSDALGISVNIIHKISNRTTWVNISEKYDLPTYSGKTKVSSVEWVCFRIKDGLSNKEILEASYEEDITIDVIKKIRSGKTHRHISSNILEKTPTISRKT